MLNLCVFIFVIYAVSYSAKVILFGKSSKKRKRAYCSARNATAKTTIATKQRKRSKPNVVKIRQTKSGRMGKTPVRPLFLKFILTYLLYRCIINIATEQFWLSCSKVFFIFKSPCMPVQGGYFFMYFITSRITTNKIISNTVSVIHITPLFGVQENRRYSVTTSIIILTSHSLSIANFIIKGRTPHYSDYPTFF